MQERDGLKASIQQLSDDKAELSAKVAAGEKAQAEASQQLQELEAAMEKQKLDADAALADMTSQRDAKVSELESAKQAAEAAGEEHASKEAELKGQVQSVTDELEDLQSSTKRQTVAWKFQKAHLTSDRDGYKGQVEALRDKVSRCPLEPSASE